MPPTFNQDQLEVINQQLGLIQATMIQTDKLINAFGERQARMEIDISALKVNNQVVAKIEATQQAVQQRASDSDRAALALSYQVKALEATTQEYKGIAGQVQVLGQQLARVIDNQNEADKQRAVLAQEQRTQNWQLKLALLIAVFAIVGGQVTLYINSFRSAPAAQQSR
jgi:uncharacterized protein YukE